MNKNSSALLFFIPVFFIPAILLIIAPLIHFPYGFYTFLRLAVFITACLISYYAHTGIGSYPGGPEGTTVSVIFVVIIVLYNPIVPIYLNREIWMPINFITSFAYIWAFIRIKKEIDSY